MALGGCTLDSHDDPSKGSQRSLGGVENQPEYVTYTDMLLLLAESWFSQWKKWKKKGVSLFYTGDQESTLSGDMQGTMKFDLQESSLSCLRLSFKVCESATDFCWGGPQIFVTQSPTHGSHTHIHTHPIPHQDAVAKTERQELPELEWLISLHLLHLHFSWNLRPGGLGWEEKRCSFERGGWLIYVYI